MDSLAVWPWYVEIQDEIKDRFLDVDDKRAMREYYQEAGLFVWWRRPFFKRHFSESFARSARFLLQGKSSPRILDLGCGLGTQALILAGLGARVAAIDMDEKALEVLKKRKVYYEDRIKKKLDIEIIHADAFSFEYKSLGPLDGVHSMFAFNMMQPSLSLLTLLRSSLASGARLAVLDGNNLAWLPRVFPARRRDVLSPPAFEQAIEKMGFKIFFHEGGVALPPLLWRLGPSAWLKRVDGVLNRGWLYPVSHHILAELP